MTRKFISKDGSGEIDREEFVNFISPTINVGNKSPENSEVTAKSSFELEYEEVEYRNNIYYILLHMHIYIYIYIYYYMNIDYLMVITLILG